MITEINLASRKGYTEMDIHQQFDFLFVFTKTLRYNYSMKFSERSPKNGNQFNLQITNCVSVRS